MAINKGKTEGKKDDMEMDVIGVEVHRKALFNITKEMAITLTRTSGSPVVTEAKDLSTCILDARDEQLAFAAYVSFHVSTAVLGVEAVRRNYDVRDMKPGDAFICNDPHTSGAVHQGDVGIVMPYFYHGDLIGWGYANEHVLDVGGSSVCGMAPEARDCFSESLRFSGIRIMQGGVLSRDWEMFIATNVRVPGPVLNDIRSMIAGNNVGQMRLEQLIDRIGLDRFNRQNEIMKRFSEEALRERISKLPNGTYESEDWVEYDGRGTPLLFNLKCRLIVHGDEMTFQFRGDPQTDCFINGAKPAMLGQAMTTLLCQFIFDIPVNSGIWRPIHFDLGAPGTIVNAVEPAPVTQSHMETGMRVNKLVTDVMTQALSLSKDPMLRGRVAGQPNNGLSSFTGFGVDDRTKQPFVIFPMSTCVALGGGAQSVTDGLDTYAAQCMTGCGMPDVEIEESAGPVMVLWRKVRKNTGGPGLFRGGQGFDNAMALVHSPMLVGAAFNSVSEVPPRGAFGGYPGAASDWSVVRSSNLLDLLKENKQITRERLRGEIPPAPAKTGSHMMARGDVYIGATGGGGGLGDPLLRPAHLVAKDVPDDYITPEHARSAYGVLVRQDGTADEIATTEERLRVRTERIGCKPVFVPDETPASPITLSEHRGRWNCTVCDHDLGPITGNWRKEAVGRALPIEERFKELQMFVRPRKDPAVEIREYFCPHCATALGVDVTLAGRGPVPAPRLGVEDRFE